MPEVSDTNEPTNGDSTSSNLPQPLTSPEAEIDEPIPANLPIPPEVLEKLPPEARAKVLEFFSAGMQITGQAQNPLVDKIEPQHITDMIGLASKTIDVPSSDRKHARLIGVITLGLILSVSLAFLLVLAIRDQNALLLDVIKIGGLRVGAFGGGYGVGVWRARE